MEYPQDLRLLSDAITKINDSNLQDNSTYPGNIDTLSSLSRAPARPGPVSLSIGQPYPVLISKSTLEFFPLKR